MLLFFAAAVLVTFSTVARSQTWARQGTTYASSSSVCVVDISAPATNVAWGIFAMFGRA